MSRRGMLAALLLAWRAVAATLVYVPGSAAIEHEGLNVEIRFSAATPPASRQPWHAAPAVLSNGSRSITLAPSLVAWDSRATLDWVVRYTIPESLRVTADEKTSWTLSWSGGPLASDADGNATPSSGSLAVAANSRVDAEGWTVYAGPWDATYYVSTSGSDSAAGSQAAPFRTPAKAKSMLVDGKAIRVLFRRGDVWTNESLGTVAVSGASLDRPIYVGAYGTGPRPRFNLAGGNFLRAYRGATAAKVSWWSVHDLDIRYTSNPSAAFELIANTDGWRIEGCSMDRGTHGVNLSYDGNVAAITGIAPGQGGVKNINVYRCAISNSQGSHGQGIYGWASPGLRVVECLLYANGQLAGGNPSNQGHNIYLHSRTQDWKFLRTISLRSGYIAAGGNCPGIVEQSYLGFSGCGLHLRRNGMTGAADVVIEGSQDTWNGTDFTFGGLGINVNRTWPASEANGAPGDGVPGLGPITLARCVVANKAPFVVGTAAAVSFERSEGNLSPTWLSARWIVAYNWSGNTIGINGDIPLANHDRISIRDSVLVQAGNGGERKLVSIFAPTPPYGAYDVRGNRYYSTIASWFYRNDGGTPITTAAWTASVDPEAVYQPTALPDPSRSLARYSNEVLGGSASPDGFAAETIALWDRASWDPRRLGGAVTRWLESGFLAVPSGGEDGGTPQSPAPPATPGDFSIAGTTSTTATVTCGLTPGADAYEFRRLVNGQTVESVAGTAGGEGSIAVFSGLAPSTLHAFTVVASNAGGASAPAAAISGRTAPHAITGVAVDPGPGKITVTWTPSSAPQFDRYRVDLAPSAGGPWTVATYTTDTAQELPGTVGVPLHARVLQLDLLGLLSDPSASAAATPGPLSAPPTTPTGLAVRSGAQRLYVSWNASPNATSYKVKYGLAPGVHPTVIVVDAPATSVTLAPLAANTTYYVVVSAAGAGGESSDSGEKSGRTTRIRYPLWFLGGLVRPARRRAA